MATTPILAFSSSPSSSVSPSTFFSPSPSPWPSSLHLPPLRLTPPSLRLSSPPPRCSPSPDHLPTQKNTTQNQTHNNNNNNNNNNQNRDNGDTNLQSIESALGKSFGGALWFSVLIASLAIFGGGYVYLIVNFADFSDIPILNGPSR